MDANGLPVNFPLRLVSDTRTSSKPDEPAHLGLGPIVAFDADGKPIDVDEDELQEVLDEPEDPQKRIFFA